MTEEKKEENPQQAPEAPRQPARRPSLLSEFTAFLLDNKKWWMIPIVLAFLLLTLALVLTATPAAPFIYALF